MTEEERLQRMRQQFEEIQNPDAQEKVVNLLEVLLDKAKGEPSD